MRMRHRSVVIGLGLLVGLAPPLAAAPSSRLVPTETIILPDGGATASALTGETSAPTGGATPGGDPTAPTGDSPTPDQPTAPPADAGPAKPPPPGAIVTPDENAIPDVEYDLAKLPEPVRRLREQIIEAAATGDPEKLRPIIDANGEPPTLSLNDSGDPIAFIKSQSGDPEGREILAILTEVLEAGYVHVDAGTPDEVYLWPYFARFPVDKLSPRQLVELFKLVYAGDYEDMKAYGSYSYYRVGIAPNGTWKFFMAGD